MKKIILLFLLFFQSGLFCSLAQTPFFKQYIPDREHRDLYFLRLIKDHSGFIWIGTSGGVYRYDGIDFQNYNAHDSLAQRPVTALYEDSKNRIWVGYRFGAVGIISNDRVNLIRSNTQQYKCAVNAIIEDQKGRIWFATNGDGVFCFSDFRIMNVTEENGLSDNFTHALALTPDGNVWVGTDQGISICKFNDDKITATKFEGSNEVTQNIIRVLKKTDDGNLLIGTQDHGIFKFDFSRKEIIPMTDTSWQFSQINCMETVDQKLWIGTDENGIVTYHQNANPYYSLQDAGSNNQLLRINDLLEDNEGNVWIAGNNQLLRSTGEQINFLSNFKGEALNFIHTILSDSKKRLWFTPDQGLAAITRGKNGSVTMKKYTITPLAALIDITALCEDQSGHLWIGTMGSGIYRMNTETGSIRKITEDPNLKNGTILCITLIENSVWVSGFEGVTKYSISENGKNDAAEISYQNLNSSPYLSSGYTYKILRDTKNRTWFATDGNGLIMLENGKFTRFSEKEGLKSSVVFSITEDFDRNIWFSTLNAGIYKYDGKTFKNFSSAEGLSDLSVSSLVTDDDGNIVIVTRQGIDVLNPRNESFIYYGEDAGLDEMNTDVNSFSKDADGNIWFGTEKGIVRYHLPGKEKMKQPFTQLSGAYLFLKAININKDSLFSYRENNFTFRFNGLWFSYPQKVIYQYKLDGYNNEWIVTKDNSVTYPRLPAGNYTFKVMSALNKSFKNAKEVSWSFHIGLPFWRQWWFIVLLVLFTASVIFIFIKYRERQLRNVAYLQRKKIEFQFETLKSQVNPHFLFNSFNTLITVIEENPPRAVEYVEHLSEFFRNILAYREKNLIPLKEELKLIESYYFLQKKRYGDALHLHISISEEDQNSFSIPPLVLQLLVENAIKHNAVSKETPLIIKIFCPDKEYLVAENNINKKMKDRSGAGMGLPNIISRYELLTTKKVKVEQTEKYFSVSVPLIKEK